MNEFHLNIICCPVCGMKGHSIYQSTFESQKYYFCGGDCKKQFEERPHYFLSTYHRGEILIM